MKDYQILLYYKYTDIEDPLKLYQSQKELCESLELKGRIIVSKEGINGTLEGEVINTEKYITELLKDTRFSNTDFKKSKGTGYAFPKLSIKVRNELVSSHLDSNFLNPNITSGKYVTAEELHNWIHSGKEIYIVDMRNDYEQKVGYFDKSLLAPFKNFRDLPSVLTQLESLKDKCIVTVCTGGVRCEKASGFLVKNGFKDVYQLYGGIVTYMEKYPNEDFLGVLYVFDGRITYGVNVYSKDHKIVGKCIFCGNKCERYYDCKNIHCKSTRHFLSCNFCISKNFGYCSDRCKRESIGFPVNRLEDNKVSQVNNAITI